MRSITATATDAAGNVSAPSAAPLAITVDTTAPANKPTGLDLDADDDTGVNTGDNITNQTSGLTITGQTDANARVQLRNGANLLDTVTANASGVFSYEATLAASATPYAITARVIDAAGNVGPDSDQLAITVDTTAPANKPTGLDLAAADDMGISSSDDITNQTSGLTITGQTDPNARVELFDGANSLGFATANGSGVFSYEATLAAGTHAITARAIDAAGNVGPTSDELVITVGTTAFGAPTGLNLAAADDTGVNLSLIHI